MTAESLKPFINNLPMDSIKKKSNLPFLLFGIFMIIVCVILSSAEIWNITRTTELQNEIVLLKKTIEEMKVTLGYDIAKDFKEFQKEYNQRLKEKGDDYDKDLYIDQGSGEFEDDDDDDNDSYDDDYDVGGGDGADIIVNAANKKRKVRSLFTNQGVPIIDQPYKRNRTYASREDFINSFKRKNNQSNEPKLKYDWSPKGDKHKKKMYNGWNTNSFEAHRSSPISYITPAEHASASHKNLKELPKEEVDVNNRKESSPEIIQNRSSRVMNTYEDKTKAFRQVISKKDYAKMMNSDNRFLEQIRRPEQVVYPRKSMKSRVRRTVDTETLTNLSNSTGNSRHRTIGIHFVGDTSRYIVNRHENYFGNGKIRNHGIYSDWATPVWTNTFAMERFFKMDEGVVTVKENGIYYVYAQIFYHDDHDLNGYTIELEETPFLQCTAMTHSPSRLVKSNSCYTGGVTYIKSGEKLRISDLGNHRFSLFEPSKSFFGLVKFGDPRMPHHTANNII